MTYNYLKDKRILIVDDEPDILESINELLSDCDLTSARTFEQASNLLKTQTFDIAILDIMGVNGYELLAISKKMGVIPVMLTANALSVYDTVKSFRNGAEYYIPKEKMVEIVELLQELLEEREKGNSVIHQWLHRFNAFYEKRFGSDWKKDDKAFWEKHGYWL